MTLESIERKATKRVISDLEDQMRRLRVIHEGDPDVARAINETIAWTAISRNVLLTLTDAALERLQWAAEMLAKNKDGTLWIDTSSPNQTDTDLGIDQSLSETLAQAKDAPKPIKKAWQFDTKIVRSVLHENRMALRTIARTKNGTGMEKVFISLMTVLAEKMTGAEVLGICREMLNSFNADRETADRYSEFRALYRTLRDAHLRWSFLAQCQVHMLNRETLSYPDLYTLAQDEVLKIHSTVWQIVQENTLAT